MSAFQTMPLVGLVIAQLAFVLIWFLQRRINDAGVVDVFWSLMVASLGLFYCIVGFGSVPRRIVAGILVATWSLRLSHYLLSRWLRTPEDGRYAALKQEWGKTAQVRLFRFYQLQAMGCVLFSIPILFAANNESQLNWLDFVGVVIFLIALVGEWTADRQLDDFKRNSDNVGKVCTTGLWSLCRHPNYFFEWMHWFLSLIHI